MIDNEEEAMEGTPDDEGPIGSVPKAGEEHGGH